MCDEVLHGHNDGVKCLALSRCKGHVASGSRNGSIIIHSTSSNHVNIELTMFLPMVSMVFAIFWMAHLWLVAKMVLMVTV